MHTLDGTWSWSKYFQSCFYRSHSHTCIPAFPKTTWASIERLILLEQTTPKESFEVGLAASGGGIPGGVDGRCSLVGTIQVLGAILRQYYRWDICNLNALG